MTSLTFTVYGTPTPQGSKKGFVVGGRAVLVDDNKPRLRSWREDVKAAAEHAMISRAASHRTVNYPDGPVTLAVFFHTPRPRSHYGTRRGQPYLKSNAPVWVDKKPDLDKLTRAVCDALTAAGVYRDDAQVAELLISQRYAGGPFSKLDTPGAVIRIAPLTYGSDAEALAEGLRESDTAP